MNLVTANDFMQMGSLLRHEVVRDAGKITVLDTLAAIETYHSTHHIVFFSHQWAGFSHPDPDGTQYEHMTKSLRLLSEHKGWDIDNVRVWVDFVAIPQALPPPTCPHLQHCLACCC